MGRILLTSLAVIVVACAAAGATEASLVASKAQTTSPEPSTHATPHASPASSAIPTPRPSTAPTPSPSPSLSPTPAAGPTATINGYVHMRAAASTNAAIVTDLYQNDVVSYTAQDAGDWQAVTYQGQAGYVYKAYLNY